MSEEVKDNVEETKEESKEEQKKEKKESASKEIVTLEEQLQETDLFASEEEFKTGKRIFKVEYNNVELDLSVRRPTNKEIEIADWEYSRYFNKAVTQGIVPETRMLQLLKEQGVWTDEDEKEIEELQKELIELELEIKKIHTDTRNYNELVEIRGDIKNIREKLLSKRTAKQQYLTHTAENKSDDHRTRVLTSFVTEYASGPKKGKSFFKDFDDMTSFRDQGVVLACLMNYMTFSSGLSVNFMNREYIEDKVMEWEDEARKQLGY